MVSVGLAVGSTLALGFVDAARPTAVVEEATVTRVARAPELPSQASGNVRAGKLRA
jgi:hypothetical protein